MSEQPSLRERVAGAIANTRVREVPSHTRAEFLADAVLAAVSAHITEGLDEAVEAAIDINVDLGGPVLLGEYWQPILMAAFRALGLPSPEQEQ